MKKNLFLIKLAKYDGTHFIKKALNKIAVPLADIGNITSEIPEVRTNISPKAQEYIDRYHGGDIEQFDSGEFSSEQGRDRDQLSREDEEGIYNRIREIRLEQHQEMLTEDIKNPKWKEQAENVFRFWGSLVYIIPVIGNKIDDEKTKSKFVSWENALPVIEKSGLNPDQIQKNLQGGAIVFLAKTTNDYSDIALTPKNLIYSFFHDLHIEGDFSKDFGKIFADFNKLLNELYPKKEDRDLTDVYSITSAMVAPGSHDFWHKSHNRLGLLAEMLTEEATTEKGFYFKNKQGDERINTIENWIKNLGIKEILIDKLKGKIVLVRVSGAFA